jgi:hypothetical protein
MRCSIQFVHIQLEFVLIHANSNCGCTLRPMFRRLARPCSRVGGAPVHEATVSPGANDLVHDSLVQHPMPLHGEGLAGCRIQPHKLQVSSNKCASHSSGRLAQTGGHT